MLVRYGLKNHCAAFPLVCCVTVGSVDDGDFAGDTCHCHRCRYWGCVACDGLEFCCCYDYFLRNTSSSVSCRTSENIAHFSDFPRIHDIGLSRIQ